MFEFDITEVTDESIKEKFICPFCGKINWEASEDDEINIYLNADIKVVICNNCGSKTKFIIDKQMVA